ncbi:MAG: sigma-E processing peptidase SpoIIGA [Oscillospiraceae bacterium]
MKTVFVDDMFLLNLIINYFILLATAKLCAMPLRRWRFALAGALGALYSVLVLLPPLRFLASPITKLALGAFMTLIAFGNARRLLKPFIAFLAVSAAFGGAVFAASMLAGNAPGEGLYINASLRVLLLSFAACYLALTLVFNRLTKKRSRETVSVRISLCGKTAEFKALRDTGNELYDPVSGLPVMVAGFQTASALLPENCTLALQKGAPEFFETLMENAALRAKFRLVPYSAIGQQAGLLPVFRPDLALINGQEVKNILVGLSPTILCSDDEYSAII